MSGAEFPRRFKPYAKYKDSGVEWLEKIPANWDVKRLKFTAHLEAGQSPPSELVTDGSDGLPFLQGNADFGPASPIPRQVCDAAPKEAEPGDILLSVRAPVGAMNVADQRYGIGRGLCAIRPSNRLDPQFCFYTLAIMRSRLDAVATGSTYDAVTVSQVGDLPGLLPDVTEQRAIAAFLDRETARIDALVAKKERLIELLQEKRAALITRAVTKGLNPNAPMKDSGVEWLGMIPAHWEFVPSAWLFTESKQRARDGDPQLSATQKYGVIPQEEFERLEGRQVVHAFLHLDQRKHVEVDDFVMSMRSFEGGLERVRARGCVRSSYIALRSSTKIHVGFFACLFKSNAYIQALRATSNFIRDGQDLNFENFRLVNLPLAPLREQETIAVILDRETARLDALLAKVRDAIAGLKELRTALISAAVTGKIDVRETAA